MSFGSGPSNPRPHRRVIHAASALLSTNCPLEPSQPGVGVSHQSHYPGPLRGPGACATVAQVSPRRPARAAASGPKWWWVGTSELGAEDGTEPLISGPAVPGGGRVSFVISPSEAVHACMPLLGWCKPQRVPRAYPAMRGTGQAAMLLSVATLRTGNQPLEKEAWLLRALGKKKNSDTTEFP